MKLSKSRPLKSTVRHGRQPASGGGTDIIRSESGQYFKLVPVAAPVEPASGPVFGRLRGQIWIADDFDQTPPEVIAAVEAEL